MQSLPITTKALRLNSGQAKCTLIQLNVIYCVSDLLYVGGFLRVLRFPSRIKAIATYDIERGDDKL